MTAWKFASEGQGHRIDFKALTGHGITIYAQQEVVKDLISARLGAEGKIFFEAEAVTVHDFDSTAHRRYDFTITANLRRFVAISLPVVTVFTESVARASKTL